MGEKYKNGVREIAFGVLIGFVWLRIGISRGVGGGSVSILTKRRVLFRREFCD
jgi:hypothetical protein